MAAGFRSENAPRARGRRVYSTRALRPDTTPLQTLLHLVALRSERATPPETKVPRDEDLKEVVSALYQVATGTSDTEEVLALATRKACSMTGATGAALALRDSDTFVCRHRSGTNAPSIGASFSADSGISGECVRSAQILCCHDTDTDSRVNAAVSRALGIRSIVVMPIFDHGTVCGILEVFADRPHAFDDRDIYVLQLLAALVAHSQQNAAPSEDQDRAQGHLAARDPSSHTSPSSAPAASPATVTDAVEHWIGHPNPSRIAAQGFGVAAGFVAAALLFAAVWVSIPHFHSARTQSPSPDVRTPAPLSAPPPSPSSAIPVQISGIEFKSHKQFTAIRVTLGGPVHQQSGRLQNPERIYFDLFNSDLAGPFGGKKVATITVNDLYVSRIRAVKTSDHSTRIVLDLKCACDYTAVAPETAPYELSILIQPPHTSTQRAVPGASGGRPLLAATPVDVSHQVIGNAGKLTVVIDPGHGGIDIGTTGPDGLAEKDLVLDIARRLGTMLSAELGATVVFTRNDDRFISLERRDQIANDAHADLLISIHANSSSDRLTRGVETFYYTAPVAKTGPTLQTVAMDLRTSQTRRLAALVQRELHSALSSKDKGLRDRGVKHAQFALLMNASVPAILTEVAFISSPSDGRNLARPEARATIAKGLFQGISDYARKQPVSAGL